MFLLYALVIGILGGALPYLHIGSRDNSASKVAIRMAIAFVINFIVALIAGYLITPFFYGPFWGMTLSLIIFGVINSFIAGIMEERYTTGGMIYTLFAVVIMFRGCSGMPVWNADDYRALHRDVEERNWQNDMSPVDITHIRVVSKEQARWLGNKVIGEAEGSIGSRYEIGDYTVQRVRGELYWVAPLEFRGFSKWISYKHTPGFVMVSAEDRNRSPELFTSFEMRYMTSSYFGTKLRRHLYTHGWAFHGLTEYSFELNDNLQPYWVITVFHPTIQYSAPAVDVVLIVDPETGEAIFYQDDEIPNWVDRVYPEDFAEDYISWYGEFVRGWVNSWWKEENVEKPTPYGMDSDDVMLIYGSDGNPYWFTGMTSSSSADQSLTGFILMNSRTGEARKYRMTGPNEEAVLEAVQNSVSNYEGYRGTQPIPYNIYGEFTWVVPVVSAKNILQRVALVRASNATVKLGMDLRESLREYRVLLSSAGFSTAPTSSADYMSYEGLQLSRLRREVTTTTTLYYLYFDEVPGIIFTATSNVSPEITISQPGDTINIGYIETREPFLQLDVFDNLEFTIRTSAEQAKLSERRVSADSTQVQRTMVKEVRRELDNLSPEELQRLYETLNKTDEQ